MKTAQRIGLLLLLVMLLATSLPAFAQANPVPTPDPNANVVFPPPVYVLRGQSPIIGTANLPNMTNYFIEFRPLPAVDAATAATPTGPTPTPVFFPAVLPSTSAVVDDVLGTWDTSLVPDGLYELRMTVNTSAGTPVVVLVTPLRVENNLDPEIAALIGVSTGPIVPTQAPPTPIPAATLTPTFDPTPRGTVTTASANVRTGDSTLYPVIASLPQGTVVDLVGISSTGSGWYQVRLASGQLGWMSPTVITVSGNVNQLPRVTPPPPPVTPTPVPTATPVTTANLVAGIVVLNPNPPVCAQTFIVGFDVANLGSTPTAASGVVNLTNVRAADGSVQATTVGGFPVLQPGQTFRVDMPLTVSTFYNETHRIVLEIDPGRGIPETTRDDNTRTIEYVLQKGGCP
jgi:uncharacterized protein YgiM (DUF1202 family)